MASPSTVSLHTNSGGPLASDNYDLALKIWSGEILARFDEKVQMLDLTSVKTLEPGADSEQFPAHGAVGATYHTLGDNIVTDVDDGSANYLQAIAQGERIIYADRECLSPILLFNVEERISKPNWRASYTPKLAHALAKLVDQNIMRVLYAGAAASATYSGGPVGGEDIDALSTGDDIYAQLLAAQENFDIKDVPEDGRIALMTTANYYKFVNSTAGKDHIDRDYQPMMVNGQLSESLIMRACGMRIVRTNIMPASTNPKTTANQLIPGTRGNDYNVDMSNSAGLICFHPEAVGTCKSADVSVSVDYLPEYRGDLVVASNVMGHGLLRPECIYRVTTA